jgi:hypothetical protein
MTMTHNVLASLRDWHRPCPQQSALERFSPALSLLISGQWGESPEPVWRLIGIRSTLRMLEDIITPPQRELLDEVCDELGVLIKVAMMRPRVVRY